MQRKSIKLQGETDETRDGANDGRRGERELPLLCTFIGIATHIIIIHILYLFFFFSFDLMMIHTFAFGTIT